MHSAIVLGGQRAQDIAASFVDAPLTSVNTSCVEQLRPAFVVSVDADAQSGWRQALGARKPDHPAVRAL